MNITDAIQSLEARQEGDEAIQIAVDIMKQIDEAKGRTMTGHIRRHVTINKLFMIQKLCRERRKQIIEQLKTAEEPQRTYMARRIQMYGDWDRLMNKIIMSDDELVAKMMEKIERNEVECEDKTRKVNT